MTATALTERYAPKALGLKLNLASGQNSLDTMQMQMQLRADHAAASAAAQAWWRWEQDLMAGEAHEPAAPKHAARTGTGAVHRRALRIGVHCARARWVLPEGALLKQTDRLRDMPGVIVQGGGAFVTPPQGGACVAWRVARRTAA